MEMMVSGFRANLFGHSESLDDAVDARHLLVPPQLSSQITGLVLPGV